MIASLADHAGRIADKPKAMYNVMTLVANGIGFADYLSGNVHCVALKNLCKTTLQGWDIFNAPGSFNAVVNEEEGTTKEEHNANIFLLFASIIDVADLLQKVKVLSYTRVTTTLSKIPYVHVVTRVALSTFAISFIGVGCAYLAVDAYHKKEWHHVAEHVTWVALAVIMVTVPTATGTILVLSTAQATISLVNFFREEKKDEFTNLKNKEGIT